MRSRKKRRQKVREKRKRVHLVLVGLGDLLLRLLGTLLFPLLLGVLVRIFRVAESLDAGNLITLTSDSQYMPLLT